MEMIKQEIDDMINEMNIDNPYKDMDIDIMYDYVFHQYNLFLQGKTFDESYELYCEPEFDRVKEIEANANKLIEEPLRVNSAVYTCSSCKKGNVTYSLVQTRSCDEGATVNIRCLDCGKKWSES